MSKEVQSWLDHSAAVKSALTTLLNEAYERCKLPELNEEEKQAVIRLATKWVLFYYPFSTSDIERFMEPSEEIEHSTEAIRSAFVAQLEVIEKTRGITSERVDRIGKGELDPDELTAPIDLGNPGYSKECSALNRAALTLREEADATIERLAQLVINKRPHRKVTKKETKSAIRSWLNNVPVIQSALTPILDEAYESQNAPELDEEERQAAIRIAYSDILYHLGIEAKDIKKFVTPVEDPELLTDIGIITRATSTAWEAAKILYRLTAPIQARRLLRAIFG